MDLLLIHQALITKVESYSLLLFSLMGIISILSVPHQQHYNVSLKISFPFHDVHFFIFLLCIFRWWKLCKIYGPQRAFTTHLVLISFGLICMLFHVYVSVPFFGYRIYLCFGETNLVSLIFNLTSLFGFNKFFPWDKCTISRDHMFCGYNRIILL